MMNACSMRIVHIVRQYPPGIGGIEEVVAQLSRAQAREGHQVRVVTLNRIFADPERVLPAQETADGVEIFRLPWRGSTRYPIAPQALDLARGFDLAHVHAIDFFFDYFALRRSALGAPLIATTHGGIFHTNKNAAAKRVWFNTLTRLSARAYDRIICCSPADFAMFQQIAPDRLTLIDNGVDVEKFAGRSARAPRKGIVTIGRFSSNKRLDLLLDAFAALRHQDPEWRLAIAGAPSDWDGAQLAREIAARGLAGAVDVYIRPSNAEIGAIVGQASLFASASAHEGFGVSLIEALSAGLAPVVAPNAAFCDFAARIPQITLSDFADSRATAQAFQAAFTQLEAQGAAGRERAMAAAASYAWPGVAARYMDAYRMALAARATS
jgi:alpha-1,3-mannosyltransferase